MRKNLFTRLATILLMASFTLVSCKENKEPEETIPSKIAIQVTKVDITGLAVKFTPNAHTTEFYCGVGKLSDLEAFKNGTLSTIQKFSDRDQRTIQFESLQEDAEHVIFAQGVDALGQKGEVTQCSTFTSEAVPEIGIKVTENTSGFDFTVTFTPDAYAKSFAYAIGTKEDEQAFYDGTLEGMVTIDNGDAKEVKIDGVFPGDEFVAYARAVNKKGVKSPVIQSLDFSVKLVPYVSYKFLDITNAYMDIVYKSNKMVPGFITYLNKRSVADIEIGTTDKEMKANILKLQSSFIPAYPYAAKPDTTIRVHWANPFNFLLKRQIGTPPGTDMRMVIMHLTENVGIPSFLKIIDFKTPDYIPGIPSPVVVPTLSNINIAKKTVDVTMTPNESTVAYFVKTTPKNIWELLSSDPVKYRQGTIDDMLKLGSTRMGRGPQTFSISLPSNATLGQEIVVMTLSWNVNGEGNGPDGYDIVPYHFTL